MNTVNKQTVLFLEPKGTILEVIRAAKIRGYHIVALSSDRSLIDSAPEPYNSAIDCIDLIVPIRTWMDHTSILNTVELIHSENNIVGVYNGVDPCAVITAKIRKTLNLPTSDPDALKLVLNKSLLRKRLRELGLSRIKSFNSTETNQWTAWEFEGAAYFKPAHGFFSAYVQRCENFKDFQAAKKAWREGNDSDSPFVRNYLRTSTDFLLEEAFDGELLSVEAISTHGKFQCIGLTSRILYSKNPIVEMGSCFPYPHSLSVKITDLVRRAHQALGLTDGPTHTEVIVNQNGDVEIIDLNPRFIGADVLQSINHAYDIKIEEFLLDFALGKDFEFKAQVNKFACLQYLLPPGQISEFQSLDFPKASDLKFQSTCLKSGTEIKSHDRQLDYLGCYLTVTPSFEESIARSKELREQVIVNGQHQGEY